MSLPAVSVVNTAAAAVQDFLALSQNDHGYRAAAREVFEQYRAAYNRMLADAVEISITDATDAGVSEFIDVTGEGAALAVGDFFSPAAATNDLTDNALATAKGSAVAAADVYLVSGADAVTYIGSRAEDFATMDACIDG